MYCCGPTVYQRIHVGNAYAVSILPHLAEALARGDRLRDDARASTSPTSTTRSTTRRPGASAAARQRRDARGSSRTRIGSGSDVPTSSRRPSRPSPRSDRDDRGARSSGASRTSRRATCTSALRASRTTAGSRGQRPDQVEEQEPNARKEISATSHCGRRTSRARTRRGSRRGAVVGRAGTSSAPSCRRSTSDRSSRSTAAASTSSSRTTRTRSRSRARSVIASRGSGCTTGCSSSTARRCRSRSGTTSRSQDALDRWGRETLLVFHLTGHWSKPLDFSDATLEAARARVPRASARCFAASPSLRRTMPGIASPRLSTTTSTRPPRSRSCTSGATTTFCAARSRSSGSSRSQTTTRLRTRSSPWPNAASTARATRDFDEADRLRAEIEASGWDVRDEADSFRLVRRR